MSANHQEHQAVVLTDSYKTRWARTLVTALAQVGVIPITILGKPGLAVTTAPFSDGNMELTFAPVGLKARVQVVVSHHDEAPDYITLFALLPDGEPLCSMFVPRGEGWLPLAEALPAM